MGFTLLRLSTFLLLLAMVLNTGCQPTTPHPDTIVMGKLYTLNPLQPEAQAVAIQGGRFSFVGTQEEALKLADSNTTVINLDTAVAYPGLIDAHVHIAGIGSALRSVDLRNAESFTELIERVSLRASALRPGTVILGTGWHQSKWTQPPEGHLDGFPTHHALSRAVPNHPVLLEHANGHSVLLNQAAMVSLGITGESIAPEGGIIVHLNGAPTGLLHETAIELTAPLQQYDLKTATSLVDAAQWHLLSQGITTAHDAGASQVDLAAHALMAREGSLILRLYSMVYASDEGALEEWLARGPLLNDGDHRLAVRAIKVQADGALGSRTAWLHAPYSDAPDTRGVLTFSLEALSELIAKTRADNWQINVHAIGDRANSEVLSVFAPFTKAAVDHRFRIEHAQHLRLGDAALFAAQQVIASMQPIHLSSDRPWAIDRLGEQRIEEGAYIWRDLLREGVLIVTGTDAPVEPANPIANFYAAVTRRSLDGTPETGFEPAQKLTRQEALYAMTLAGAYAAFEENEKGSIEVGKLADITVLSQDLMTVEADRILDTVVSWTMVNGEVVYSSNATKAP